jgi:hypothetical protein
MPAAWKKAFWLYARLVLFMAYAFFLFSLSFA